MIIAFSPEQAHEVSQAFGAPWWLADSLHPESVKNVGSKDANDAKPAAAKKSTDNAKKSCRANPTKCRPSNVNHSTRVMFPPCRQYQQAARRQRQASNSNSAHVPRKPPPPSVRPIVHHTPIHMHEETPDAARMSLDVTGFQPEHVSIQVDNHVVHIQGKRTNKLGDVFVLDRKFRLDKKTALVEGVTATFDEGVLELTVPKKPETKSRTIPIVVTGATPATKSTSAPTLEPKSHDEDGASEGTSPESVEEETIVFARSEDEVEGPQSLEDTNPEEKLEINSIDVETVQEEEPLIQEEEEEHSHNETNDIDNEEEVSHHTNDSPGNKSAEDETWEEVSN